MLKKKLSYNNQKRKLFQKRKSRRRSQSKLKRLRRKLPKPYQKKSKGRSSALLKVRRLLSSFSLVMMKIYIRVRKARLRISLWWTWLKLMNSAAVDTVVTFAWASSTKKETTTMVVIMSHKENMKFVEERSWGSKNKKMIAKEKLRRDKKL